MWKNDKVHGKGKYTHTNGATYDGDWKYNFPHGKGVEFYNDGSKYNG